MPLTVKAFDLLLLLVENRGREISKAELMEKVWTDTAVADNTFHVTLHTVRKALGDYSKWIVRKSAGYCFTGEVSVSRATNTDTTPTVPTSGLGSAWSSEVSVSEEQRFLAAHPVHEHISSIMYGLLFGIMLLAEVAYDLDKYRRSVFAVSIMAGLWAYGSSLATLRTNWKLAQRSRNNGLIVSALVLVGTTVLLCVGLCWYLPPSPITQQTTQAATAQSAYFKDTFYHLLLALLFILVPYDFVVRVQRELCGKSRNVAIGLLIGSKLGISPKGSIYLRPWALGMVLLFFAAISHFAHHNLVGSLKPGVYMNLFTNLLWIRLALFYGLGIECLVWYYRKMQELRREYAVGPTAQLFYEHR